MAAHAPGRDGKQKEADPFQSGARSAGSDAGQGLRKGENLPNFNLSAIWPVRSVPTLADLFAGLDLGSPDGAAYFRLAPESPRCRTGAKAPGLSYE